MFFTIAPGTISNFKNSYNRHVKMTSKGSREHLCMAVIDRLVSVHMSPCSPTSFDVVIDIIMEETQGGGSPLPQP